MDTIVIMHYVVFRGVDALYTKDYAVFILMDKVYTMHYVVFSGGGYFLYQGLRNIHGDG